MTRRQKHSRAKINAMKPEMIRLYSSGISAYAIARLLDVSASMVMKTVKKSGVEVRRRFGRTREERVWDRVMTEPNTGCWFWEGRIHANGYAMFGGGEIAHRVSYEESVGPIPDGLELDHKCRNRACVNPDHLEPVTHRVNQERAPNSLMNRAARGEVLGARRKKRAA